MFSSLTEEIISVRTAVSSVPFPSNLMLPINTNSGDSRIHRKLHALNCETTLHFKNNDGKIFSLKP